MLSVDIVCVGKLKEKFYTDACDEYVRRLGAFCNINVIEFPEVRRPKNPSPAEVEYALRCDAERIRENIPKGDHIVAMCIEGKQIDSVGLSQLMERCAMSYSPRIAFVIGASEGLDPKFKKDAEARISMSKMTFPHHLARVMLLEQVYRGFCISNGNKYHK